MIVHSVVGARPQFVKAAVVSRALRARGVKEILTHTGQHYDRNMSDVFFETMDIPAPDHHLGIGSGQHGSQTGRMLEAIESLLLAQRPDWMLVYGDTNSTLAGALAAAKLHIPIAHVEAGLRSFNRRMPEEVNRVLTDHCSTLLLAPTQTAVLNLQREGIAGDSIRMVGDVMYDAALFYAGRAETTSRILEQLGLHAGSYMLATIHRAENTDDPRRLEAIIAGLSKASASLPIILPLHPRTAKILQSRHDTNSDANLRIIEPVDYLDMIRLEQHARLIITDSGGVQKEAYFHRVPCVTLRDETEWVELVEHGYNRLVPPHSAADVAHAVDEMISSPPTFDENLRLYGNGDAGALIAETMLDSSPVCAV